ncbi:MAG TPA: tol-pal system protein YbgF [Gemmatimonadota bacterium]|nr:tol-pal system protein YbgF [Gemmatimonadota bacterium]
MSRPANGNRARRGTALAAVAALALGACATRGDIDVLMVEHQRVLERQDDLQAQLDAAQQSLARLEQLLTQIRADFAADLGAVRSQMNAVESALRGTESRIEQLRRYTPTPVPMPVPGDTSQAAAGDVDPIDLYNAAITDYQQGRLDLARQGFTEYLRRFPDGVSASDARYWLGITWYDQERWDSAIAELREVPTRWPESSKAPLALRKIGDAYRAQGDEERARAAYQQLVQRYPNSAEADAARRQLGD